VLVAVLAVLVAVLAVLAVLAEWLVRFSGRNGFLE